VSRSATKREVVSGTATALLLAFAGCTGTEIGGGGEEGEENGGGEAGGENGGDDEGGEEGGDDEEDGGEGEDD
jgi:hypothetical protein